MKTKTLSISIQRFALRPLRHCAFAVKLLLIVCTSCADDPRHPVVNTIREAAALATTETIIDKIVFGTSDKKLLGIIRLNEARFAAYSTATITTGIDLDKLRPDDIKIQGKHIELKLPPVEVLNFSYPFSSFRIDESITDDAFLNKIDVVDQENFYRLAETDIRSNLPYCGIALATQTKTRQLLYGVLRQAGYEEIYITFHDGSLTWADDTASSSSADSIRQKFPLKNRNHEH